MLTATFATPIALLFLFIPPGIAVNYTHQHPALIFVLNFLAIIPSAATISFLVDEISLYFGDTVGGLLDMAFSNVAQLISSIFLLRTRQFGVLRSSLVGSILQNLLLMTGLAFLFGGLSRHEQNFNPRVAQTMSMFLLLAVLSLTIPTVSQLWARSSIEGVAQQSRGTAVIIIVSYLLWLIFQLRTDTALFKQTGEKVPQKPATEAGMVYRSLALMGIKGAITSVGTIPPDFLNQTGDGDDDELDRPQLSRPFAFVALIIFTVLLALNTQYATDSVQGIMASKKISEMFMGIVVLPLLSNDPITIEEARKDKMDRSLALTLERCMQTALMVVPLVVLIAWGMGENEMTLAYSLTSI